MDIFPNSNRKYASLSREIREDSNKKGQEPSKLSPVMIGVFKVHLLVLEL